MIRSGRVSGCGMRILGILVRQCGSRCWSGSAKLLYVLCIDHFNHFRDFFGILPAISCKLLQV